MNRWLMGLVAMLALSACSTSDNDSALAELGPGDVLVGISYQDSSVPPEFHRSWELLIADGEAEARADSYGDPQLESETSVDDEVVADFLDALVDIGSFSAGGEQCAGSFTLSVTVSVRGPDVYRAGGDRCGDEAQEQLDRLLAAVEPLRAAGGVDELIGQLDTQFDES